MASTDIVTQLTTTYDNKTFDTGRTIAVVYFMSAILYTGIALFKGQTFDPQAYLLGGGGFLMGLGAYIFGDNSKNNNPSPPVKKGE